MAITVAKYTFGSWLRKGIASSINEPDHLGAGTSGVKERATVPVDISVNAQPIHKDFALLGPGDVIGINPKLVVRTEPLNWITDFEPNYLPFIEFYEEDFAWRYTPARPSGDKLRPWIALIVLKQSDNEDEQEFAKEDRRLPLPTVTVKSASSLPPHTQIWAWVHVHTNEGHESDSEFEAFLKSLHNLNDPNADKIICRLMCPRRLEANSAYRAFVVPAFETGRMAGLGQETTNIDAQQPSWNESSDGVEFPVYYEWFFRTGENEDFESLVELLEPRKMDSRVGIRDMDGSEPGFGMTEGTDIGAIIPSTVNQEIIGLEGALKAPTTKSRPEVLNLTKPFFGQLESILNFPAELAAQTNNSTDPVVSPPIYGENHARHHELDINNNGWLHHLNKDPRLRVPSGFGTNVIQKNQEDYMARAWAQVQKILEANKKINLAAFAMMFATKIQENFISKLEPEKTITFLAPLLTKVKGSPNTLHYQMEESRLPTTAVSASFRRIMRPRGVFFKKLQKADTRFNHTSLLQDLNEGKISPAPPKPLPAGIDTVDKINESLPANSFSPFLHWLLKNRLLLLIIALILLLLVGLFTGAWLVVIVLAVASVAAYIYLGRWAKFLNQAEVMSDPAKLAEAIKNTAPQPSFSFTETDPVVPAAASGGGTTVTQANGTSSGEPDAFVFNTVTYHTPAGSGQDSLEAKNFRAAAVKLNSRLAVKAPEKTRQRFDLVNAQTKLRAAVDPRTVFPKQLATLVYFSFNPTWLLQPENLVPAMAYPDFEDPMYAKLRDISSELLIPNLELIPRNTISILVTNPEFIESYMVGLNHEFGKELLWREYPTDKRGSYFRQFWEVKGIINNESGLTKEQLTEKYKDIKPLDIWTSASRLGEHSNRLLTVKSEDADDTDKRQVVLVVRGDLLKKYPQTIIYAQKARIHKENGTPKPAHEPVIVEVQTAAEMAEEIKFPIFKAEIDPDFKFFGFDLTIGQAGGDDDPQTESDDWGYFFVIQQIPGDPRFGMDTEYSPDDDARTPITWDDLSWDKYAGGEEFIKTTVLPDASFVPHGAGENRSQWGTNAAVMACILYQKPVMIAVHAKEILEGL